MSNTLPKGKVHDLNAISQQKQQMEMQKASFIASTRLQMSQSFLNTLIGRLDVDLTKDGQGEALVDMSVEFSNTLMIKLGLIVPNANVE